MYSWRTLLSMIVLTLASGCGDECEIGEYRCTNDRAQNCISGDDLEPYWAETACDGAASYCLTPDALGYALCSVLDGPMPGCPENDFATVCLSTNMVTCQDSYAINTKECMICDVGKAFQTCSGRLGDPCLHKGECLPGLECMDVPDQIDDVCTLPCDCSNGPCDTCSEAIDFAKTSAAPQCTDGMCL